MAQARVKRLFGALLYPPSPYLRTLSSSSSYPPLISTIIDEPISKLPSVSRVNPVGASDYPLWVSSFPSFSSFPGPTLPPFFRPQPALSQLGPRHCFPIGGFPTTPAKSPLFLSSPSPLLSQSATPFHWPSVLLNRRTELPLLTNIPTAFISKEVAESRFQSIREITRKLGAQNWDVVRLQRGSLVIKEEQNVDGIDRKVLNWPNTISFGRLLAGPILACFHLVKSLSKLRPTNIVLIHSISIGKCTVLKPTIRRMPSVLHSEELTILVGLSRHIMPVVSHIRISKEDDGFKKVWAIIHSFNDIIEDHLIIMSWTALFMMILGLFLDSSRMLMHGYTQQALFGFVIAGLSDWLDGYVARRQGINSVIGSYLDPLADKVLVGCVVLSMAQSGLLSPGLVALIIARDGALVCGAFVHRAYTMKWKFKSWQEFFNFWEVGAEKMEPLFISKVNTVLQLGLVSTALLQSAFAYPDTYSLVPLMSWAVAFTTCTSWGAYMLKYMQQQPRTTSAALSTHMDASALKKSNGVKQMDG